ncbi:hypothetical protein [Cognatishimia sp. F0-27]|uniref:hypothetical protein n=1 Tax=Cognatishimia sp. F0-27 TaxID=2816855 RepID=UPI001D0CB344|nr:hypothetical protein [Cognatishimia sp. F0-27]MCC1494611.1 hypothetical protein [Cognatishimia sp. F0-27]
MTDIYAPTRQDGLSLEELALYHIMMEYRAEAGLPPIPLSASLTLTAGRHVVDTIDNIWRANLVQPEGANLHSWSDAPYFSDHRDPTVMWEAPQRLGTGYTDNAFEITGAGYATIDAAMQGWIGSPPHLALIENSGIWADDTWNAIGIGVEINQEMGATFQSNVYHVWFGRAFDQAGPPTVDGSTGSEDIRGTVFADRIFGNGGPSDTIEGRPGNDTLVTGSGADVINGGLGSDFINSQFGDDSLVGGVGFDTVIAGPGNDTTYGLDGFDSILAGGGDDLVFGGNGNDTIIGGTGADTVSGGIGSDSIIGQSDDDSLQGFGGFDTLEGGDGNDTLAGNAANDSLYGNAGDDLLIGGFGYDLLVAGAGNDTVLAGNGADTLLGGPGADVLTGNAGVDLLQGGADDDILTGGLGRDIFVFGPGSGVDRITDFEGGWDILQIDADLGGATPLTAATLDAALAPGGDGALALVFGADRLIIETDVGWDTLRADIVLV